MEKLDKNALMVAGGSLVPIEAIIAIAHGQGLGAILGLGGAAIVYNAVDMYKKSHPETAESGEQSSSFYRPADDTGDFWYKLTHGKDARVAVEAEASNTNPLFYVPSATETDGVERLTIEEIVENSGRNDYQIWIGRSMTKENNRAVRIGFYKRHFRFIGTSQYGKSSMVAAFLTIVAATHDPKHVRIVLLDKENLTSNLFVHLPHVIPMELNGQFKQHATNDQEVLQGLILMVAEMERRYSLMNSEGGIEKMKKLPIILVYVEEFLQLKGHFKSQLKTAKDKEQAQSDYETLMYCINALASRGLKARIQLMLCAQVEYADDDFREAMANVKCGFSFCVPQKAAMAAGFKNADLLRENEKANKVGQAVVETPDCQDIVLSPYFPVEEMIEQWQANHEYEACHDEEVETGKLESTQLTNQASEQARLKIVTKQDETREDIEIAIQLYANGATSLDKLTYALRQARGSHITDHYVRKFIMPAVRAEMEKLVNE